MITVIGLDGSPLSPQAVSALATATLVVGGQRHLGTVTSCLPAAAGAVPDRGGAPLRPGGEGDGTATCPGTGGQVRSVVLGPLAPALEALAAHDGDAVVLASGDPGFFGIVRALRERGLAPVVLPAVSSVAQAFARAGLPWDDAMVVSAHGRDLRRAVNVCRAYPKVAVLTGPGTGPGEIGAALAGWPRRLLVAEALGSAGERITECPATEAAGRSWTDPNVVLVLADLSPAPETPLVPPGHSAGSSRPEPQNVIMGSLSPEQHQSHDPENRVPRTGHSSHAGQTSPAGSGPARQGPAAGAVAGAESGPGWCWPRNGAGTAEWALAEEAFEHRDSMVTKAEVRALALARLGPRPGDLIWDVGAGSGSVAVECARFGAAVVAVDRDPAQCARISSNAARHAALVRVVDGEAPGVLAELPAPDAVFVGGGGAEVVAAVTERRPSRIVVALAAVERAGPVLDALGTAGYAVGGSLLQAGRLAPLPDGTHRLAAANPVFLVWAAIPAAETLAAAPGNGRRASDAP